MGLEGLSFFFFMGPFPSANASETPSPRVWGRGKQSKSQEAQKPGKFRV